MLQQGMAQYNLQNIRLAHIHAPNYMFWSSFHMFRI